MRDLRMRLAAALMTLATASAAHAGQKVMWSAPASQDYPGPQNLNCDILNADTKPHAVTIEIVNYFGAVVGSFGPATVDAGKATFYGVTANGVFCKFTVDGSPKKFRAAAIYDNGSTYTLAIPAY